MLNGIANYFLEQPLSINVAIIYHVVTIMQIDQKKAELMLFSTYYYYYLALLFFTSVERKIWRERKVGKYDVNIYNLSMWHEWTEL